jgi:LacI family transcriptional regulator
MLPDPGGEYVVTIKDVAREAGVSTATVSRVYNEAVSVADNTRVRVQRVGTRLGYVPHAMARSLITRRTATIGVILPDLHGEFFSEIIRGVDTLVRARGYHLLVSSSHSSTEEVHAALQLMRGRVDGLLVLATERSTAGQPMPGRLPTVRIGAGLDGISEDVITVANHAGAMAMGRHLLSLGHRRIAVITGGADNIEVQERLSGFRAALREAGLAPDPSLELAGDFTEASGYAAGVRLAAMEPHPSAVFALNDSMAIGAMSALRAAGLDIPRDVAVAGFDDIPTAQYLEPPLTTVRVDISALGARAAERLFVLLRSPERQSPLRSVVPTSLVIRRSCGSRPDSLFSASEVLP